MIRVVTTSTFDKDIYGIYVYMIPGLYPTSFSGTYLSLRFPERSPQKNPSLQTTNTLDVSILFGFLLSSLVFGNGYFMSSTPVSINLQLVGNSRA